MLTRTILRSRAARLPQTTKFTRVRFASTAGPETASGAGAVTGGLAGGAAALAIGYGYYHFSGAKSAVRGAQEVQSYVKSAKDSLKVQFNEKTPDTNQAIETLKEAALKYASWIPGGRQYVDTAFRDLESIRQKHGSEVDNIVREAYEELRDVSKKGGLNLDTAGETYNVLSKHAEKLMELASDASEDIMNNHPELKQKLGGSTDQLKQLAQRIGPDAKKEVDETWKQVREIVQQGLTVDSANRVRQMVQEKIQKLRQMAEKAFNQGFEQLKPMLEKNPAIKKIVEENMDTLKSGNITEGIDKVRNAISSGSTQQLESYLQEAKNKTQQFSGGQLSSFLESIPNGSVVLQQLQKVKDVAENRGDEAQDLIKDLVNEIRHVLDKKSSDVEDLYQKGKQDVKSS